MPWPFRRRAQRAAEPDEPAELSQALWLVAHLCRLHRVPVRDAAVADRCAPPLHWSGVRALLDELGIATNPAAADTDGWVAGDVLSLDPAEGTRLMTSPQANRGIDPCSDAGPAIPVTGSEDTPPGPLLVLVLAADDGRVLLATPASRTPLTRTREALRGLRPAWRLRSERRAVPADDSDPDGAPAGQARFGWGWFATELLRHRRIWRDVVAASLAFQLDALAIPLATQAVVDKVIIHRSTSTLVALGVGLVVMVVFSQAMSWLRQALVLHTGNRVDAVLASTVFARLVRLPIRFFERRPTGVLTARLQGVEQVREFIAGAAVTLVLDLPLVLVFLALMLWYSPLLSAVVGAALVLIVGLSLAVVPAFRRRLDAQFRIGARHQAFVTEHLAGIETVKTVQMEAPLQQRNEALLAQHLQAGYATRQLANGFNTAAGALEQLMTLGILFVGAWLAMTERSFTVGMLVAFQMFASRLSQPVMRAVGLWQNFQQTRVAVRRLADIMDVPMEPHALLAQREPVRRGGLRLEGLAFRHGEERPWLFRGLSLDIPAGSRVALMGPSGCGKSTLAKLMLGLYPPGEGRVLLDGHDIARLPVNELRRSFGVVPQETVLFSGSVLDNLMLGAPHAPFEQVVAACRMAGIHEVIEALPEGYQTPLGERGVGLSGGQKQRLAIARALLKRPQVLVFDEATANLDGATAQALARTINALKGKVTLVFIAHQLPRGLEIDHIVRLDAQIGTAVGTDRGGGADLDDGAGAHRASAQEVAP